MFVVIVTVLCLYYRIKNISSAGSLFYHSHVSHAFDTGFQGLFANYYIQDDSDCMNSVLGVL